ncbi:hypothetical protein ACFFIX_19820 [Metabacillus herbersteinensis]|uniref:Uncharacterized protein n=1 Tax=Metabacillus herbersteinensis TaxID=283816 RepID=A0ABV6GJK7_9BACI
MIATIVNYTGTVSYASIDLINSEEEKIDTWCKMVESYSQWYSVKRLPNGECVHPEEGFVLLRYPAYTLNDLKSRVLNGKTFPAGVTRFLINGRLLNLSIPLDLLISENLNETEWYQLLERLQNKIRFYSESIYLCEA